MVFRATVTPGPNWSQSKRCRQGDKLKRLPGAPTVSCERVTFVQVTAVSTAHALYATRPVIQTTALDTLCPLDERRRFRYALRSEVVKLRG
jgi:hypothetical protein